MKNNLFLSFLAAAFALNIVSSVVAQAATEKNESSMADSCCGDKPRR